MADMDIVTAEEEDYPRDNNNQTFGKQGVKNGNRVRNGANDSLQRRMVDITRDKPIKVTTRVVVPVRDHPKFNFVGKLLGPKGNSLKRLQEDTMTKMAILGRGSMRDRHKEEELRISGDPKFSHLSDDLHVEITAFAPPAEAHARIAYALTEVRRFLVPDYNDGIRQEQMWEMQLLNGGKGEELGDGFLGTSTSSSSNGMETPPESASPTSAGQSNPAFRGVSAPGSVASGVSGSAVVGRKRPLFSSTRASMSPTKRTVMSILARTAQSKELNTAVGSFKAHISNGRISSGLREDSIIPVTSILSM